MMSIEAIKRFQAEVKNDKGLTQKLASCQTNEQKLALAKARGFELTIEEMAQLDKVSDEELDNVSGGRSHASDALDDPNSF